MPPAVNLNPSSHLHQQHKSALENSESVFIRGLAENVKLPPSCEDGIIWNLFLLGCPTPEVMQEEWNFFLMRAKKSPQIIKEQWNLFFATQKNRPQAIQVATLPAQATVEKFPVHRMKAAMPAFPIRTQKFKTLPLYQYLSPKEASPPATLLEHARVEKSIAHRMENSMPVFPLHSQVLRTRLLRPLPLSLLLPPLLLLLLPRTETWPGRIWNNFKSFCAAVYRVVAAFFIAIIRLSTGNSVQISGHALRHVIRKMGHR